MEEIRHANIVYVGNISNIGGVETWVYEIIKKYKDYDIAVVCKECDIYQKYRLEQYCRVYKHTNQKIICKVAIINCDTSIIDYITEDIWKENAKEDEGIYQTIHTDYKHPDMGKPPQDDRIKCYLAITQYILDGYIDMIHCNNIKLCRNPLQIEDKKTLIIVSPTRLTNNKGGDLMLKLANCLDRIGIRFLWFVLTSEEYKKNVIFQNKNVIYIPPRLDTSAFYNIADWCVLPSKVEGDSYTLRESLYRGVGIVVRELPYFKEIGIEDGVNALFINDDNVMEIAKKMVKPLKFKFKPIEDSYDEILYKSKSRYEEERAMKVEVKCISPFFDIESQVDRILDEQWDCSRERGEHLVELHLVEITRTIKEDRKEKATPKRKVEKAVK